MKKTVLLLIVVLSLTVGWQHAQASILKQKSDTKVLLIARESSAMLEFMLTNEVGVMISMLKEAGFNVVVATISGNTLKEGKASLTPDLKLADVKVEDYAGFVIPCMAAEDFDPKTKEPEAVEIVIKAAALGKPIAAQLSGVGILGAAGVLKGKKFAMPPEYKNMVPDGIYMGTGVVQDGNIITSGTCPAEAQMTGRKDGTPELIQKLIALLAQSSPWVTKSPMPTARYGLSTSVVNGKIYAIGGASLDQNNYFPTVEEYNPATDTWTTKKPMPTSRCFHSASVVNGMIYVIGGASKSETTVPVVEVYNPVTDTWTTKTPIPTSRCFHSASVVNGMIYVIGGKTYTEKSARVVEMYNPVTDTWTLKTTTPTPRGFASASAVDGKIYIIGGCNDENLGGPGLNLVEVYDPATNIWTTKKSMPTSRKSLTTSELNNKIYAIGGASGTETVFSAIEVYDPAADKWTVKAGMTKATCLNSSSAVNGKIYVFGGSEQCWPWVGTAKVEEYSPDTTEVGVKQEFNQIPDKVELLQNYPNPFNPTTNFEFRIANSGFVSFRIFDLLGKEVAILLNEEKTAGYYKIQFNGNKLSSGIYFYQLRAGDFSSTKQFVLLK